MCISQRRGKINTEKDAYWTKSLCYNSLMAPDIFDASKDSAKPPKRNVIVDNSDIPEQVWKAPKKFPHPADKYSEVLANEQPCANPFAAFAPKPIGMSFDTQEKDEQILLFLRQHPIVNVPWILLALVMLLAPGIFSTVLSPFLKLPVNFAVVLSLGWYLITLGFIVERVLIWLFDSFIITDERMIDIDFKSMIFKDINYANLDKIQDVNVRTSGAVYSLLDVGSVFVQTAGEVPEFVFNNVAQPSRVAKLLNELSIQEEQEKMEGRVR